MSYIFLVVQVLYILLCMTNIQYYNFIILILSDLKKSKTNITLNYYGALYLWAREVAEK